MERIEKELKDIENKILKKIKELIKKENLVKPEYIDILTQKGTLENIKIYKSTYKKKVKVKGKKYEYKPLQLHITLEGFKNTITIAHAQNKKRKEKLNQLYKLIKAYQTVKNTIKGLKEIKKIKKMIQ